MSAAMWQLRRRAIISEPPVWSSYPRRTFVHKCPKCPAKRLPPYLHLASRLASLRPMPQQTVAQLRLHVLPLVCRNSLPSPPLLHIPYPSLREILLVNALNPFPLKVCPRFPINCMRKVEVLPRLPKFPQM